MGLRLMNHDDEYHGDINYGNMYPDDWYWFDNDDSDKEDVIDYGKGRLTSSNDQQSTWYQGPQ